jgi:hypothetical protein
VADVDAAVLVLFEREARPLQQVNRILRIQIRPAGDASKLNRETGRHALSWAHGIRQVEFEVELPRAALGARGSLIVGE